jgi:SAM-dependent methyltransferase|mmetsp:Transcript_85705/g.256722  ORF Transcript_85705/g.256722 Transcript_85705/m.256722 type:complete len:246 (-) Transcript_85705:170-907(-)
MLCGVRSSALAAVRRWARQPTLAQAHCGSENSLQPSWDQQYEQGTAQDEWFLGAEVAAELTVDAFHGHVQGQKPSVDISVLNLGCGTSRLGQSIASSLAAQHGISAHVMNVDYSPAAIRAASASPNGRQHYCVWDVTDGSAPPRLPGSRGYDLLVDKGTMDVLLYTGPERVVAYSAALRACLLPSNEARLAPLFVHYSDDESRVELLEAAFPAAAGWRVDCSHVDSESAWGTYRLQVCAGTIASG